MILDRRDSWAKSKASSRQQSYVHSANADVPLEPCVVLMRISAGLPDGNWREVGETARTFEELGFDQAAAHETQHDCFATLVPATLSTHRIGLTTSVAIAFPRSPMIVAILAQDLNV